MVSDVKGLPGNGCLRGRLLALSVSFITGPSLAVLSGETGQIQGTAPTATENLQVLFPGGTNFVTNNAMVGLGQIPDQFTVSSSVEGLILQDADGDSGLSALVDTTSASLSWKHNETPLTVTQLGQPFGSNFLGKVLTLEVNAPVTINSVSGLPTTSDPQSLTTTYTLSVPDNLPTLDVNGQTFALTDGFPTTVFGGAFFDIWMNGSSTAINGDYTWSTNQPWVTLSNDGRVEFTRLPTGPESRTVYITATHKHNGDIWTHSFTVENWFTSSGEQTMNWNSAVAYCTTQGFILASESDVTSGTDMRGMGSLFAEWGPMKNYSNSSIVNGFHWTSTPQNTDRYRLITVSNGSPTSSTKDWNSRAICRENRGETIAYGDFNVASGAIADDTAANALSATVKDGTGDPVPDIAVEFSVTSGAATPATQTVTTDSNGVATASLVSRVAGSNQVTASVGGNTTTAKTSTFLIAVGTESIAGSQRVTFYPRTFSTAFEPDDGHIFDDTCLTVTGSVRAVAIAASSPVSGWGDTTLSYNTAGDYSWSLVVSNSCGMPVSGTVVTQLFRYDGAAEKKYFPVNVNSQGGHINEE